MADIRVNGKLQGVTDGTASTDAASVSQVAAATNRAYVQISGLSPVLTNAYDFVIATGTVTVGQAFQVNLPSVAGRTSGKMLSITNAGTGQCTVARDGTDLLSLTNNWATIVIGPDDTIHLLPCDLYPGRWIISAIQRGQV